MPRTIKSPCLASMSHDSATMVVPAESGHSWKRGIPRQLEELSGELSCRVLLPEIPGRLRAASVTEADSDYLLRATEQGPLH